MRFRAPFGSGELLSLRLSTRIPWLSMTLSLFRKETSGAEGLLWVVFANSSAMRSFLSERPRLRPALLCPAVPAAGRGAPRDLPKPGHCRGGPQGAPRLNAPGAVLFGAFSLGYRHDRPTWTGLRQEPTDLARHAAEAAGRHGGVDGRPRRQPPVGGLLAAREAFAARDDVDMM